MIRKLGASQLIPLVREVIEGVEGRKETGEKVGRSQVTSEAHEYVTQVHYFNSC